MGRQKQFRMTWGLILLLLCLLTFQNCGNGFTARTGERRDVVISYYNGDGEQVFQQAPALVIGHNVVTMGDVIIGDADSIQDGDTVPLWGSGGEVSSSALFDRRVRKWPDGRVPYVIDSSIIGGNRDILVREISNFNKLMSDSDVGIRMVIRNPEVENDYIRFADHTNIKGANYCGVSRMGRRGGEQPLGLVCYNERTIHHEILHALGVPHEHNRSDRDSFIDVVIDSDNDLAGQFILLSSDVGRTSGNYDFLSVMHYTKNSDWFVPINYNGLVGGSTMSQTDLQSLQENYGTARGIGLRFFARNITVGCQMDYFLEDGEEGTLSLHIASLENGKFTEKAYPYSRLISSSNELIAPTCNFFGAGVAKAALLVWLEFEESGSIITSNQLTVEADLDPSPGGGSVPGSGSLSMGGKYRFDGINTEFKGQSVCQLRDSSANIPGLVVVDGSDPLAANLRPLYGAMYKLSSEDRYCGSTAKPPGVITTPGSVITGPTVGESLEQRFAAIPEGVQYRQSPISGVFMKQDGKACNQRNPFGVKSEAEAAKTLEEKWIQDGRVNTCK